MSVFDEDTLLGSPVDDDTTRVTDGGMQTTKEGIVAESGRNLMQLTQKHRTLAFSEQHNELESEYDQPKQAKCARIDTLDALVLTARER